MNAEKAKEKHAETKEAHGNALEEEQELQVKSKIMAALLEGGITQQHKHQKKLTREVIDSFMAILRKECIPNSPDCVIQFSNVGMAIHSFLLDLKESAWEGRAYEGGSLICNTVMFSGEHRMMALLHSSYPWLKSKRDPVVIVAPPLNFNFQAYLTNQDSIQNDAAVRTTNNYYPKHSLQGFVFNLLTKVFIQVDFRAGNFENTAQSSQNDLSYSNFRGVDTTFEFAIDYDLKKLTALDEDGEVLDEVDIDGCPLSWACYSPEADDHENVYMIKMTKKSMPCLEWLEV